MIHKICQSALVLVCLLSLIHCTSEIAPLPQSVEPGQPFFGIKPTAQPQIVGPGTISQSPDEYNGTFSPDGREFYFTAQFPGKGIIAYTKLDSNNIWSEPTIAPFSGSFTDYDPLFAPDGKRLYFSSERPLNEGDQGVTTHIFYVEKKDKNWSDPVYVPLSGKGDYFSSLTKTGTIYYNIWSNGDIYKATPSDTGFVSTALPEAINGKSDVGDAFISPDEDYLIFRGYHNSLGNGDLYISFNIDGVWTEAENLGEPINSRGHEMCPYVTINGKLFIFASNRLIKQYSELEMNTLNEYRSYHRGHDNGLLNIYSISTDFIDKMRSKHQ